MQFTIPAAAFLAFVSGALGQVAGFDTITSPKDGEVLVAGESFTIVWEAAPSEYDDETVTIILVAGEARDLLFPTDEPIAAGIVNSEGSYEWQVPSDLGHDEVYGLRIQLDSDPDNIFQYSFPFEIEESDDIPIPSGNSTASATKTDSEPTPTPSDSSSSTPPQTTVTSTFVEEPAEPTPTDDSETSPGSGAGANAVAGVALVGGLFVAALGI